MKSKPVLYFETHPLPFNKYLVFFIYIMALLIVSNILPVLLFTYFLFFALGLAGIFILIFKHTYSFSINEKIIRLSIKIPLKIPLVKLKIKDIESIGEVKIDALTIERKIRRTGANYRQYIFKKETALKLNMTDGKVFIIAGIAVNPVINLINGVINNPTSLQNDG